LVIPSEPISADNLMMETHFF